VHWFFGEGAFQAVGKAADWFFGGGWFLCKVLKESAPIIPGIEFLITVGLVAIWFVIKWRLQTYIALPLL
jgi:hypothetical protein